LIPISTEFEMTPFEALVIAIVEGLTEFLPVSSTGHMIIAEKILGMSSTEFTRLFAVNIQFGAILSVVVLYWKRFVQSFDFYLRLGIAFFPAAVIGFFLIDYIDRMLESVLTVAVMMVAGGVILLFIDRWLGRASQDQAVTPKKALYIGLFQCIAMIPGVSRSAATIIGGMSQGLTRTTAAEFSFFLAVPTMFAAGAFKLFTSYRDITVENTGILLLGNLIAFITATIAIKGFIAYLMRHGFRIFGWYRIAVGLLILVLHGFGYSLSMK